MHVQELGELSFQCQCELEKYWDLFPFVQGFDHYRFSFPACFYRKSLSTPLLSRPLTWRATWILDSPTQPPPSSLLQTSTTTRLNWQWGRWVLSALADWSCISLLYGAVWPLISFYLCPIVFMQNIACVTSDSGANLWVKRCHPLPSDILIAIYLVAMLTSCSIDMLLVKPLSENVYFFLKTHCLVSVNNHTVQC